jgi:hypothetical protein
VRSRPGYRIGGYADDGHGHIVSIDIHAVIAATILSPFLLVVESDILRKLEVETVPIMQD